MVPSVVVLFTASIVIIAAGADIIDSNETVVLEIEHRIRALASNTYLNIRYNQTVAGPVTVAVYRDEDKLCTQGLHSLNRSDWTVVALPCSCFIQSGDYIIHLQQKSTVIAYSTINVPWATIGIELPQQHTALQSTVDVTFTGLGTLCAFETDNRPKYDVLLVIEHTYYEDNKLTTFNVTESTNELSVIPLVEPHSLWTISQYSLPCHVFDRAGVYNAVLRFLINGSNQEIARSNNMNTDWLNDYKLLLRTDGINPGCQIYMPVSFKTPKCRTITRMDDRVRLYGIVRGPLNGQSTRLKYISEQRIKPQATHVQFRCSRFDLIYTGFCFKLITVLPDGHVREQASQCVPMDKRISIRDGHWSEWADWSSCSNGCGNGMRHRYRLCDHPKRNRHGATCPGPVLQSETCTANDKCSKTPQYSVTEHNQSCLCGCSHNATGLILLGMCETSAVWIIQAPTNHRVTLRLIPTNHRVGEDGERLLIREGTRAFDDLLYDSELMPKVYLITSGGNTVRIEYDGDINTTDPILVHLASYAIPHIQPTSPTLIRLPGGGVVRESALAVYVCALGVLTVIVCCVISPISVAWLYAHTKRRMYCNLRRLPSSSSIQCNSSATNHGLLQQTTRQIHDRAPIAPSEDMIISTTTQSTRFSAVSSDKNTLTLSKVDEHPPLSTPRTGPTKRSVGVQLYCVDSPGPSFSMHRRGSVNSRDITRATSRLNNQSALSLAGTEQDFEYDYYEPAMPGSYLIPPVDSIDIDEIIGDSELMRVQAPASTRSVSTSTNSNKSHSNKTSPNDLHNMDMIKDIDDDSADNIVKMC